MRFKTPHRTRLVAALGACLLATGCNDQVLLEKLDQQQANQMLSALQRRNIGAHKVAQGKGGYSITVPSDDYTAAVDTLNALGLPPRARVEISQAFPEDSMVASPTAERTRLLSLTEQRLEQTITTIEGIDRASVHISYPLDDSALSQRDGIHIAALVVHEPGIDEQELIAKLSRFLKNSVSNVSADHISITLFESAPPQFAPPVKASHARWDWHFFLSTGLDGLACIGMLAALITVLFRRLTLRNASAPASLALSMNVGQTSEKTDDA